MLDCRSHPDTAGSAVYLLFRNAGSLYTAGSQRSPVSLAAVLILIKSKTFNALNALCGIRILIFNVLFVSVLRAFR